MTSCIEALSLFHMDQERNNHTLTNLLNVINPTFSFLLPAVSAKIIGGLEVRSAYEKTLYLTIAIMLEKN